MDGKRLGYIGSCAAWVLLVGCASPDESATAEDLGRLEAFVDAALQERITPAETEATYESLDQSEREIVRQFLETKTSTTLARPDGEGLHDAPPLGTQAAGANWQQPIENVWTYDYPAKVFSTFSYVDWYCDDDPSDKEYAFYYPYPSASPSLLRWTSTSSQVYLAFMVAYGGNLLGFGYNKTETRLCIGDNGVFAAGGEAKVKSNVFVHY
ncbi:MAG: hypothetical protein U0441_27225 [Polyangiaceae bacterium]